MLNLVVKRHILNLKVFPNLNWYTTIKLLPSIRFAMPAVNDSIQYMIHAQTTYLNFNLFIFFCADM